MLTHDAALPFEFTVHSGNNAIALPLSHHSLQLSLSSYITVSLFSLRKTFRPLIKNTDDASLFFLYSVQLLNYSQLKYVTTIKLSFL